MSATVKIIADSIGPNRVRLTSMECTYWLAIHAEHLRHRSFSFSVASARAIPGERYAKMVDDNPYGPIHWGGARKGMQMSSVEVQEKQWVKQRWETAQMDCFRWAMAMLRADTHKSITNRILAPFAPVTVLVTGDEDAWANFFNLRLHPDADPNMQQLAKRCAELYVSNFPRELEAGEWHLPYIRPDERGMTSDTLLRMSAARCARVSYLNHDKRAPSATEDLDLFDRLVSDPMHASPLEHQAQALEENWANYRSGNLRGWEQHRKNYDNEAVTFKTFDLAKRLAMYGDRDFIITED